MTDDLPLAQVDTDVLEQRQQALHEEIAGVARSWARTDPALSMVRNRLLTEIRQMTAEYDAIDAELLARREEVSA